MASSKEYALLCLENPLLGKQYLNGPYNPTNPNRQQKTFKARGKPSTSSPQIPNSIHFNFRRDEALLKKYGLKPNDAILAEEKHMDLYEDLLQNHDAKLIAGGAAQNTARGTQVFHLRPNPFCLIELTHSILQSIFSPLLQPSSSVASAMTNTLQSCAPPATPPACASSI